MIKKIGRNPFLTTVFSVATCLVPANIALHASRFAGASGEMQEVAAQFTAAASAATIAHFVTRAARKDTAGKPPPPLDR